MNIEHRARNCEHRMSKRGSFPFPPQKNGRPENSLTKSEWMKTKQSQPDFPVFPSILVGTVSGRPRYPSVLNALVPRSSHGIHAEHIQHDLHGFEQLHVFFTVF